MKCYAFRKDPETGKRRAERQIFYITCQSCGHKIGDTGDPEFDPHNVPTHCKECATKEGWFDGIEQQKNTDTGPLQANYFMCTEEEQLEAGDIFHHVACANCGAILCRTIDETRPNICPSCERGIIYGEG